MTKSSICFILPGWITKIRGGAEWQCYLLSEEFVKLNWSVSVITSSPDKNQIEFSFINPYIRYYYYKRRKSQFLQYIIALYSIIKIRSDYFYTRTDDKIYRAACSFICRLTGRKMIYALAGDDEVEYNKTRINKKSNLVIKLFRAFDYGIVNLLTNKSENKANLVISQTIYQQRKLLENKGLNSILIRNSYVFNGSNRKATKKEDLILWIGNFRLVKQPELFIEIAKLSKLSSYTFLMIGEQSDYKFDDLPENIKITGPMDNSRVHVYLKKAKVLVNTSIMEGFSNTFLEAWVNNVFVASLNVNPDNFLNGELGFCAKGDIIKLTNKVIEISKFEQTEFKKIGEAFSSFSSEFELQNNMNKLVSSIEMI